MMCFRQMLRADGIDLSIYSTLIMVKASKDRPNKLLAIESYCVTAHRIASHIPHPFHKDTRGVGFIISSG